MSDISLATLAIVWLVGVVMGMMICLSFLRPRSPLGN